MSDARSSTLRCLEIAGRLMEKGAELRHRRLADREPLDDASAGGVRERTEDQIEILAHLCRNT